MLSQQKRQGWAVSESVNNTFSFSPPPAAKYVRTRDRCHPRYKRMVIRRAVWYRRWERGYRNWSLQAGLCRTGIKERRERSTLNEKQRKKREWEDLRRILRNVMKWETLMVVCFLFRDGAETYQRVKCKVWYSDHVQSTSGS